MKIATIITAMLLSITALARPEHVPEDAQKFGDHYYKVVTLESKGKYTWFSAAYNKANQLKGKLGSVTSAEENAFIKTLAGGKKAWLGVIRERGGWILIDPYREPATYQNFLAVPKKRANHVYIDADGKWNAVNGHKTEVKHFVCKWKDEE